jgi:hypothetical protein
VCSIEQSLVGESYLTSFSAACRDARFASSPRSDRARPRRTSATAVRKVHEAKPDALVHCGFGFGILHVNSALEALGWDPPRFTSTAFQNAWINPVLWKAFLGWTGIDQYDEATSSGSASSTSTRRAWDGGRSTACPW